MSSSPQAGGPSSLGPGLHLCLLPHQFSPKRSPGTQECAPTPQLHTNQVDPDPSNSSGVVITCKKMLISLEEMQLKRCGDRPSRLLSVRNHMDITHLLIRSGAKVCVSSVVFLPQPLDLRLIMRKQQTSPKPGEYSPKLPRSRKISKVSETVTDQRGMRQNKEIQCRILD